MITNTSGAQLATLTKELLARWRQTREYWTDAKAREFEERFMAELETTVNSAVTGMSNLERAIRKVRSDCE